ncbi:MAG: ubiquinol-cytochrome c reductase iron-sulfur subunit [Myxococcales bacterium]|nr:Rieske 2Fe-2S domain-containing protein [Myxococcales bacterium]
MTEISRRALIRTAAAVSCAKALSGCARRIDPVRDVAVGAAVDGELAVSLAAAPELERIGGAIVAHPAGSRDVYLVVNTGTGYFALNARCPHAGCEVTWVPEDREAECPCHGSRFAGDGTVLNPPATAALPRYPADLPDARGNIVVHLFAGDGVFKERVENGQVQFPIAEFPALASVGGAILGRPDGFPSPLLVTRVAATGTDAVAAVSAICSHLGCTVLPHTSPSGSILHCPCHGSEFDLTGAFIQGPAAGNPLLRFAASFDGATVTVSTQPRG